MEEQTSVNLEEEINRKLGELCLACLEEQEDRIKDYLNKIEKLVQEKKVNRMQLIQEYKAHKLSVANVAKDTKIARQTIYNNKPLLEGYISQCIKEQEEEDIFREIEVLNNQIKELKQTIFKMQVRDLTIEKQAYTISELKSTIKNDKRVIETLEVRNRELIDRVNELECEMKNGSSKIVNMARGTK